MPLTSDNVTICLQCGKWYKFATMTVIDQRFCPECMRKIDEDLNASDGKEMAGDHHAKYMGPYMTA